MSTATENPPPINTKRSRRNGVINLPAPDVPPSPPLPPLPAKSPLRARTRSSVDSATIAAVLAPTTTTSRPSTLSAPERDLTLSFVSPPDAIDIAISSSPSTVSGSAVGYASPSTTSLSPSTPSSVAGPSGTSKRTHALRELLDTERAYASDLALVREVYVRLARDPMDPFAAAPLPTGPPTPKARPLKNRGRASSGGRPKTAGGIPTSPPLSSPPFSRAQTSSVLSPSSFIPSLKRKGSSPSLTNQSAKPDNPPPRHRQPMSDQDIAAVFLNIEKLAALSEELCRLLHVAIHGDPSQEGYAVGSIMMDYIPRMLPYYKVYIAKHDAAARHLQAITPTITSYLSTARVIISPLTNAWDLPSLLIKPVQRILKYPLLLSAIADASLGEMPGTIQLREAKRAAEKACNDVNEAKRNWEEVGSLLKSARQRKLATSVSGLPNRVPLPPALEMWDQRLETMEKSIRRFAGESREWVRGFRTATDKLVLWADANERTMRVGMIEGESHDGRGRWSRSAVEEIIGGIWRLTDSRVQALLIPALTKLLVTISSPRLLMQALRSSLPDSIAGAVSTQLLADLPQLAQLASRAYTYCIKAFAKWQCELWEGVRIAWGKALGEESGEWLQDLEGRLKEDTVVVDPALQEQIQLATPALVRNNHFTLPPRETLPLPRPMTPPVVTTRPRSMDATELTTQLYGLHIVQGDDSTSRADMFPRSITFDDLAFSHGSFQSPSASSPRDSADTFYKQPSTQSSSSEILPHLANGDPISSTPSLELTSRPSASSSLAPSDNFDEASAGTFTVESGMLRGLPLDEALRSVGVQEIDLADDPQAQWAGLYQERKLLYAEGHRSPPETPDRAESMSLSAVKGLQRLKSSASTKSLTRIFNRSRATTPERTQTPPLPPTTPPMANAQLPWASSYSYQVPAPQSDQAELAHYNFYPMPSRGAEVQPQPMLAQQTSVKDTMIAYRQHSKQTSASSTATSNPGLSPRSSGTTGSVTSSPPGSAFVPPPQPRRVHFLASPITAFHLPTPRYSTSPYTFHGLPFLTLRVGDIITVIQECGRPTDYRDFPLWTDGQEDRLLVARAEGGHEGWVLASFVLPISA